MSKILRRSTHAALLALSSSAGLVTALPAQTAGPLLFVPRAELAGTGTAQFGRSLSLSGGDLLVRAAGGFGSSPPGRAFVFHESAGAWSQQAVFDIPYGQGMFCTHRGTDVSIAGDTLAIGQPSFAIFGKAWLSKRTGSSWSTPVFVADVSDNYYNFGQSVLMYGGVALVGVPDDPFPGAFWVWRDTGSAWQLQTRIYAPQPGHYGLGAFLVSSGTTLLAGEDDAVSVFVQGATVLDWTFQALIDPPGDALVRALAIEGDVAVVSTIQSGSCSSTGGSSVIVYERSGATWDQGTTLPVPDGASLALRGDTLYVGKDVASGTVRVFQRLVAGWSQTAELAPSPAGALNFGASLATDGTTLCVGAPGVSTHPGTVHVFDVVALASPQSYCTAKVNSQGCLPQMASSGVPGATNANAFTLGAANVINQKTGLLLYTTIGPASTPFQGGTLCLAQPLRRTPAQSSGGSAGPDDCSGSYAFDFNAWVRSGIDPALVPGVQVWAQYYSRDPADPFQVGLTDAIAFTLGS